MQVGASAGLFETVSEPGCAVSRAVRLSRSDGLGKARMTHAVIDKKDTGNRSGVNCFLMVKVSAEGSEKEAELNDVLQMRGYRPRPKNESLGQHASRN